MLGAVKIWGWDVYAVTHGKKSQEWWMHLLIHSRPPPSDTEEYELISSLGAT